MRVEYSEKLNFMVSKKMKDKLDTILKKRQDNTPMSIRMSDILREAINEYVEARQ